MVNNRSFTIVQDDKKGFNKPRHSERQMTHGERHTKFLNGEALNEAKNNIIELNLVSLGFND